MRNFYSWIRNVFGFTETETRGFIVLSALMSIFILLPIVYHYMPSKQRHTWSDNPKDLDSLFTALDPVLHEKKIQHTLSFGHPHKSVMFRFNPNTATAAELTSLGLKRKIILTMLSYRKKGGIFRTRKDLSKIYGLSSKEFERLFQYIALPDTLRRVSFVRKIFRKEILKIDLNSADTIVLQELQGIGTKLAARIIRYREALGGFVDTTQISEVYGLDSFIVTRLKQHFFIKINYQPRQLDINASTIETLAKHPYIGRKNAKIIFNYRMQHSGIHAYEAFKNIIGISDSVKEKMKPYLQF